MSGAPRVTVRNVFIPDRTVAVQRAVDPQKETFLSATVDRKPHYIVRQRVQSGTAELDQCTFADVSTRVY